MEILSAGPARQWFYKYPAGIVGVLFLAFLVVPFVLATRQDFGQQLLIIALMAMPVALIIAYTAQFKRVGLLGTCLVVIDGKRKMHVPLGQVLNVSKTVGVSPDVILVELRAGSPVGRRILFIASEGAPIFSFRENPVVTRLRLLMMEHPPTTCPHVEADAAAAG